MSTIVFNPDLVQRLVRPEEESSKLRSVPLRERLMKHIRHLVTEYGEVPLLKIRYLHTGRVDDERIQEWATEYERTGYHTPAESRKLEHRLRRELQALKDVAATVSERVSAHLFTLDKLSDAELLELHSRLLLKAVETHLQHAA